jgi:PleD family two-component response regulator
MTKNDNKTRILLVEDNPADARLLKEYLADAGGGKFELVRVERFDKATEMIDSEQYDVILLDLCLPDSYRLDTVVRVRSRAPSVPIVVLTGMDDETISIEALQIGAQDYLVKGQTNGPLLVRTLRYAIERKRAEIEREQLIKELKNALVNVKRLSGLLPICASCKRIRDDKGYWAQIELYIHDHSEADFTHGICPDCIETLYGGRFKNVGKPPA